MATVSMIDKAMQTSDPPIDEQKAGRCMLLELPVELRLQIYSYLWEPPPPFVSITIKGSTIIRHAPPLSDAPALMATCRRLNTEIGNIVYYRHFSVTIQNHSATSTLGEYPGSDKVSKDFLRDCSSVGLTISFNGALWNLPAAVLLDNFHETLVLLRGSSCLEEFYINVDLTNVAMFTRDDVMGELESTKARRLMSALRGEKDLDELAVGWRMLWKLTAVLERDEVFARQKHEDVEEGEVVVGYDGVSFEYLETSRTR